MAFLRNILYAPKNYLKKIDDESKVDGEISKTLEGKASLLAALEAEKARSLGTDLIIHVIFYAIFIAILFMQRDVTSSAIINSAVQTSLITQQIDSTYQPFPKTYLDVGQWDEYEDFIRGVLVPGIAATTDYSGRNLTDEERWNVQYVNRVVGSVRVRQMRVRNDSCTVSNQFKKVTETCYATDYNRFTKAVEPFGPPSNTSKYTYTANSGSSGLFGHLGAGTYWDASGYVVDIPLDDKFEDNFNQLLADDFYGPATRAMLITVNTITPNFQDRASVLYLLAEFTPGGQVTPFVVQRTFRISMYIGSNVDNFRAFLEIVFCIFIFYYIFKLVHGFMLYARVGRTQEYISDLWNLLELANLALFVTSMVMYFVYLGSKRTQVDLSQSGYIVELESMAEKATTFYQISAINILLSAMKTFKYLQMHPRLYVLWETMYEARVDMSAYLVMFLIILLGFLFFGWLTFGPDLGSFNGFASSLGTLWQFLIGNPPDYGELSLSNRVLGPVYYALFTVFVFFILVNMFVAIIGNSHEIISNKVRIANISNGTNSSSLQKQARKIVKIAKAIQQRRPIYSETELLRLLPNKDILEKDTVTKQELEQALKDAGEVPLSLYIERLQSIHEKRKKFLNELKYAEKERVIEELEDEYDRRLEHGESVSSINFKLQGIELEETGAGSDQMAEIDVMNDTYRGDNNNNNNNNNHGVADAALVRRVANLEAKMDLILQKLDRLLANS